MFNVKSVFWERDSICQGNFEVFREPLFFTKKKIPRGYYQYYMLYYVKDRFLRKGDIC